MGERPMRDDTAPYRQLPALPCACANLRRAARAVTQFYEQQLRGTGLNATQFTLLQFLSEMPGITQGDFGRLLALDSTTLTRTLRPLIRLGWVRGAAGRDRRERRYALTPAGRRELRHLQPHWRRAQQRLHRALGTPAWKRMQALLVRVAEAAQQA
jgi:DNA-binding MarR family transcriptional regulator